MRTRLRALGLAFVLAGAMVLAAPTFGVGTLAADRVAAISTADDPEALLAVETTGDTPDNQNTAVVVEITNRAGQDFDTLATTVQIDDATLGVENGFADALAAGETTGLELRCDGGGNGEATITIDAAASGSSIAIDGYTFTTTVSYSCTGGGGGGPGNGDVALAANDVREDDTQQTFEFDTGGLTPNDAATLDLSGVDAVAYDGATVTAEGGTAQFVDAETIEYVLSDNNAGTVTLTVSGIDVVSTADGNLVAYSDDRGQSDSDAFDVTAVASGGGSVNTDGDAIVPDDETAGSVDAGGNVEIGDRAGVDGDVDAGGTIDVGNRANVGGDVTAGGDVRTGDEATFEGSLSAGGDLDAGPDLSVDDGLTVGGELSADSRLDVGGDLTAQRVEAGDDVTVSGATDVDGDVIVGDRATFDGGVDAGGDVELGIGGSVGGDLTAGGNVTLGARTTVSGSVTADVFTGCTDDVDGTIDADEINDTC